MVMGFKYKNYVRVTLFSFSFVFYMCIFLIFLRKFFGNFKLCCKYNYKSKVKLEEVEKLLMVLTKR